jgi:hypothetical protein
VSDESLPIATRLWLCWACFFRVLLDGAFAARVRTVSDGLPALAPAPSETDETEAEEDAAEAESTDEREAEPQIDASSALALLALLQREGRFVDFVEQDIASFSDDQIGAAARVVHDGCRKAIRGHLTIEPVHDSDEGSPVEVEPAYRAAEVKLTGNVRGAGPFKGTLRHKGWRATHVELPRPVDGHDPKILAPAEVEL